MNAVDLVIAAAPYIRDSIREDVAISVYDREKFLYFASSDAVKVDWKAGDPLFEGNKDFKDLKDGREKNAVHFDGGEFGAAFDSVFIPIKDEHDEVLAILSITYSTNNHDELRELMGESEDITNRLLDGIQHVAAHSEELNSTTEEILGNTKKAVEHSEQITQVASFIKGISEQTNLLGLNAAIEAARVGEAGAGFGVVAKEIRKMSVDTKEATGRIEQALLNVQKSIKSMETEISEIVASSGEQAKSINDFMETIELLNQNNQKLNTFIKRIIDVTE